MKQWVGYTAFIAGWPEPISELLKEILPFLHLPALNILSALLHFHLNYSPPVFSFII